MNMNLNFSKVLFNIQITLCGIDTCNTKYWPNIANAATILEEISSFKEE